MKNFNTFYSYKKGKMYSTCKEYFNKMVRCELCNKELTKSCLRSHVKKQHVKNQYYKQDDKHQEHSQLHAQLHSQLRTINNTGVDLLPTKLNIDDNNNDNNECNRTLIVGPSFCGKAHLLLNKLQLIRLCDSEKQIKIITRSPGQYQNIKLEDVSLEEDLKDRTIQDFKN